jgi:hypothetical protein
MALGLQSFRRLALSQTDGAFMVITSYLSAFYRTDLSQLTKFESGFIHGFRRGFEQWVNSLQGVGYRNWERRNGTTWTEVSMSQYSEDQAQQRALEG